MEVGHIHGRILARFLVDFDAPLHVDDVIHELFAQPALCMQSLHRWRLFMPLLGNRSQILKASRLAIVQHQRGSERLPLGILTDFAQQGTDDTESFLGCPTGTVKRAIHLFLELGNQLLDPPLDLFNGPAIQHDVPSERRELLLDIEFLVRFQTPLGRGILVLIGRTASLGLRLLVSPLAPLQGLAAMLIDLVQVHPFILALHHIQESLGLKKAPALHLGEIKRSEAE